MIIIQKPKTKKHQKISNKKNKPSYNKKKNQNEKYIIKKIYML